MDNGECIDLIEKVTTDLLCTELFLHALLHVKPG